VMQGAKPKRSMVFLAVTLEELGLMGSKYYAQNPLYPLRNTVANINIDALPPLGPTSDVVVIGSGNSELEDLLKPLVQAQNRVLESEPTPENGFYFRSDHFNFARVGVPALYIKSGPTHREKGRDYGIAWAASYTKDRYHKPADQLMPDDDYRGVIEDMALMLGLGEQLANSTQWPNWYPQSEFRAARDAMRPAQP
jgi:Zn-dependent M28 family amino/carboxypeptidase